MQLTFFLPSILNLESFIFPPILTMDPSNFSTIFFNSEFSWMVFSLCLSVSAIFSCIETNSFLSWCKCDRICWAPVVGSSASDAALEQNSNYYLLLNSFAGVCSWLGILLNSKEPGLKNVENWFPDSTLFNLLSIYFSKSMMESVFRAWSCRSMELSVNWKLSSDFMFSWWDG